MSVNRCNGDSLVGLSVRVVRVNRGNGDSLVGPSVRGVTAVLRNLWLD